MWVYDKPVDRGYMRFNADNAFNAFEMRMETISMLMIFSVVLCYLSSSERKA